MLSVVHMHAHTYTHKQTQGSTCACVSTHINIHNTKIKACFLTVYSFSNEMKAKSQITTKICLKMFI